MHIDKNDVNDVASGPDQRMLLVILDGWGHGPDPSVSAIDAASTYFMESLYSGYPNAELTTHGVAAGLPDGQMGNSEVGHLNIGAGRVVYQVFAQINKEVEDDTLKDNVTLLNALKEVRLSGAKLHLLGLVSDGGVHSHIEHLKALCAIAEANGVEQVYIHAFTDGRDVDPRSGAGFIDELQHHFKGSSIQIASVIGRYFAMDRDKRWERMKQAYDLLVNGIGDPSTDLVASIKASYGHDVTDEFILPITHIDTAGVPIATIEDGDAVLFFNFRTDRPRQLTTVLSQEDLPEYGMHALKLQFITMTAYDEQFSDVQVIFRNDKIRNTLGEHLSHLGKTQLRIAETEKYPHVTYFFSGGEENTFVGEQRILIPSSKVATYDLKPEMSANELTDAVMSNIAEQAPDFICLNFANTDMVGHTGVFKAAIRAAETVDHCMSLLIPHAISNGYGIIVIADHGNSDTMINADGSPNTTHTKNPVPVIYISNQACNFAIRDGKLADIAPTILFRLGLPIPEEMNGNILLEALPAI